MDSKWRASLQKYINDNYIHSPQEWFDMLLSTSGMLNLSIVSNKFAGIPLPQRREQLQSIIQRLQGPTSLGFISLYTVEEANTVGLSRPAAIEDHQVYSWHDLATWAVNASESSKLSQREPRIPRTITFYSFKGGVGRTTALTHVAAILAMRGRKVVAVDLDLEAPGLSSALNLTPFPPYGIVDYFYERAYMPDDEDITPRISITEIFGEVLIPDAPGRLFVVPAGLLNLDYIAKVDDLRASVITERGEDLWSIFFREITEQLRPDVILVDSRTGINEWGAFSLLRAADKAIVFLYPNEQNKQGIYLLANTLKNKLSTHFVFSPVPSLREAGMEMVQKQWESLQKNLLDLEEEEESTPEITEPIVIPYLTGIALADSYPVQELAPYYARIANLIDEDTTTIRLSEVLANTNRRWEIIENLKFPEVNATDPKQNLRDLFQRTANFDKLLDDSTCLIRGRKGTGKSALYWLLLKHTNAAKQLSHGRLERVVFLSGHGRFHVRPTRNEFQQIDTSLKSEEVSWESFWLAYLLLRLHLTNNLQQSLKSSKNQKFASLLSVLKTVPKGDHWQSEHTQALISMITKTDLFLMDALSTIDTYQRKKNEVLWLLYDDLDEDILDQQGLRQRALTGLFQLVQASDARRITFIRYKIFLREDIWNRLNFDNKSHFNGRDLILKWTRVDFLKLALRQTLQSKEFADLVGRFSPIENIDQANEDSLDQALQLLWGSRREANTKSKYVSRWVFDRLTDSSNTTFPRSLNILLNVAKDYEINTYRGLQHVQHPMDRLLRPKSLDQGLVKASEQRCEEISNEYPELTPFFRSLVNVDVLVSEEKLREVWRETMQEVITTFKDFVEFLLDIGLVKLQSKEQGYRFAEIYTYGFNMYRGTRKH